MYDSITLISTLNLVIDVINYVRIFWLQPAVKLWPHCLA